MKVWLLKHQRFEPQVYAEDNLQEALKDMQWEEYKDRPYTEQSEGYYYLEDWASLNLVEVHE